MGWNRREFRDDPHRDGERSPAGMGAPGREESASRWGAVRSHSRDTGTVWGHVGVAHLANGTGPGLQRFGPISSQLLHFFPGEEELKGEAKPAGDEPAHEDNPVPALRAATAPSMEPSPAVCAPHTCWGYLSVGPGLVTAWWALLTPREMRSPLWMWPRGSVHFSVSKKSKALSREHQVRWKSAGMGRVSGTGVGTLCLPSHAAHTHPLCSSWPLGASGGPWLGTGTRCVSLAG